MDLTSDIYFDDNYGKLYEMADQGEAVIFSHESAYGTIRHQFIKRRIPDTLVPQEELYDIVTPYGYGGPIMISSEERYKKELEESFRIEFSQYCRDEKIVSEFVRFHPIVGNALDFEATYHPIWDRHTLGTNLKDFDDPVQSEFTKRCRKNIRQALNKGVSWKITHKPKDLTAFQHIYYNTMQRNEAAEYYYFDDDYFSKCLRYYRDNLLLIEAVFEDKVIAAGIYFLYGTRIHVHLSGTLQDYLYLSPAYVLRYALTCWGKENGYELIHHGGGRSNTVDDTLFTFKKQFAINTQFDFYIGRKIWIPEKYDEICARIGIEQENSYFPAYRARR